MNYCLYFQAKIVKEYCWIVTSSLRFSEYVAFDRACDASQSLFEFFVAPDLEEVFLNIMQTLQKEGIVLYYQQLPNPCRSITT